MNMKICFIFRPRERRRENRPVGREMKMKKIRQLCIVMLAALMMFSSVGIKAKEQPQTAAQDVKIEVIHDGEVVESGYNRLTHHRNYVRSTSRTNGDEIVITTPEGVHYLMVQLDEFCGRDTASFRHVLAGVRGSIGLPDE